jgi:hypothetical protein
VNETRRFEMAINGKTRSFRRGWQQVRPVDMPQLKLTIMDILGISNRNDWGKCIGRGRKMYDLQVTAIEYEFGKLGVDANKVWDDPTQRWEVVIMESTGNVRLNDTETGLKRTFDNISELIKYARREHIELTVDSVSVDKGE